MRRPSPLLPLLPRARCFRLAGPVGINRVGPGPGRPLATRQRLRGNLAVLSRRPGTAFAYEFPRPSPPQSGGPDAAASSRQGEPPAAEAPPGLREPVGA